jgi:hypothetical protein
MSNYAVSATSVTAIRRPTRAELFQAAIAEIVGDSLSGDSLTEWVGSRRLDALAQPAPSALNRPKGGTTKDRGAPSLALAERRWETIVSSPMTNALVNHAAGPIFKRATKLLSASKTALAGGDVSRAHLLASKADRLQRSALRTAAGRVRVEERLVVADATGRALRKLGYRLDIDEGERSTGLWATRRDTVLAVLVQDGGVMENDWIGHAGDACQPAMAEFTEALAAEGVESRATRTAHHGNARGGEMVSRAVAAARGGRPVTGLVAQFERGVPVADSPQVALPAAGALRQGVGR